MVLLHAPFHLPQSRPSCCPPSQAVVFADSDVLQELYVCFYDVLRMWLQNEDDAKRRCKTKMQDEDDAKRR
jgi:hypothetical protein